MNDSANEHGGGVQEGRRRVLVIGYGSTIHSDDAAGPAVALRIAEANHPDVQVITPLHLTQELAQDVGQADLVIFVDAAPAASCPALRVEQLDRHSGRYPAVSSIGHAGDPLNLLDMAEALYGTKPQAWLIAVPAYVMELGESLSPGTARLVDEAVGVAHRLLETVAHA